MAVYFNPAVILGQLSQQNPFYNPFSPYPNVGGGIASTLQQLYALRQLQEQQRLKQEQWQKEYELQQKRLGLTEKGLELEEQRLYKLPDWLMKAKALSEATGKPLSETIPAALGYTAPEEQLELTRKKAEITAQIGAKYRQPSAFKEKINEIKQAHKQGLIDNAEYKEAYKTILGIEKAGGLTPYQAINTRESIARNIRTIYNNYIKQRFGTEPKEDIKKILVKPKLEDMLNLLSQGIDLKFPQEFNIALANVKAGVATNEERKLVDEFITLAEIFKGLLTQFGKDGIKNNKEKILNLAKDKIKSTKHLRWFNMWLENPDLWVGESD